uniref:Ferredoxin-thioredoxin reductase catalytic chain, chloroplastic n=1 Tax=Hordeum vulgare subsp. vulgare TaxID=112509 RepID=A0A8I6Y8T6_HORVV
MMSITSTAGTLLCPPPVSRGGRRGGRCAVRAQAAGDGGAAYSSEQKSVEIMRKFSEQYARCSCTFFCSDKFVTAVVIKALRRQGRRGAPRLLELPVRPHARKEALLIT